VRNNHHPRAHHAAYLHRRGFAALVGGAFYYEMLQVKSYAATQTRRPCLTGKEKLKVSTHAMALSWGKPQGQPHPGGKVDNLRRALKGIRFEADDSGISLCTRAL